MRLKARWSLDQLPLVDLTFRSLFLDNNWRRWRWLVPWSPWNNPWWATARKHWGMSMRRRMMTTMSDVMLFCRKEAALGRCRLTLQLNKPSGDDGGMMEVLLPPLEYVVTIPLMGDYDLVRSEDPHWWPTIKLHDDKLWEFDGVVALFEQYLRTNDAGRCGTAFQKSGVTGRLINVRNLSTIDDFIFFTISFFYFRNFLQL